MVYYLKIDVDKLTRVIQDWVIVLNAKDTAEVLYPFRTDWIHRVRGNG